MSTTNIEHGTGISPAEERTVTGVSNPDPLAGAPSIVWSEMRLGCVELIDQHPIISKDATSVLACNATVEELYQVCLDTTLYGRPTVITNYLPISLQREITHLYSVQAFATEKMAKEWRRTHVYLFGLKLSESNSPPLQQILLAELNQYFSKHLGIYGTLSSQQMAFIKITLTPKIVHPVRPKPAQSGFSLSMEELIAYVYSTTGWPVALDGLRRRDEVKLVGQPCGTETVESINQKLALTDMRLHMELRSVPVVKIHKC